jgi:hypothetical protein
MAEYNQMEIPLAKPLHVRFLLPYTDGTELVKLLKIKIFYCQIAIAKSSPE